MCKNRIGCARGGTRHERQVAAEDEDSYLVDGVLKELWLGDYDTGLGRHSTVLPRNHQAGARVAADEAAAHFRQERHGVGAARRVL